MLNFFLLSKENWMICEIYRCRTSIDENDMISIFFCSICLSKLTKTFPITFSQTFKQIDFNILLNLNSLFTQILFNYISCYYANNVTNNALSTAEIAYNIHWYKLPWRKQHFVKLMIARAQKPFFLKGYDIVDCSLSTFLNVNLIRCAHAHACSLSVSFIVK